MIERTEAIRPVAERTATDMKIKALAALTALTALLGGCGSTDQSQYPIGVGNGPNSLKVSPCACLPLPNAASEPGWVPTAV